jgi:hypothetical protein
MNQFGINKITNCNNYIISKFTPLHQIDNHLFIGSKLIYKYPELLRHIQVSTIIGLRIDNENEAKEICDQNMIELVNLNVKHSEFKLKFNELMKKIELYINYNNNNNNNNNNIIIHCRYGQHRSLTIICAILIKKYKINWLTAFQYVKSIRNCVEPEYIVHYNEEKDEFIIE